MQGILDSNFHHKLIVAGKRKLFLLIWWKYLSDLAYRTIAPSHFDYENINWACKKNFRHDCSKPFCCILFQNPHCTFEVAATSVNKIQALLKQWRTFKSRGGVRNESIYRNRRLVFKSRSDGIIINSKEFHSEVFVAWSFEAIRWGARTSGFKHNEFRILKLYIPLSKIKMFWGREPMLSWRKIDNRDDIH